MDYYLATHLELVGKCWGDKLISERAIKGSGTPNPDTPPGMDPKPDMQL